MPGKRLPRGHGLTCVCADCLKRYGKRHMYTGPKDRIKREDWRFDVAIRKAPVTIDNPVWDKAKWPMWMVCDELVRLHIGDSVNLPFLERGGEQVLVAIKRVA